jgi:hypothetical protein
MKPLLALLGILCTSMLGAQALDFGLTGRYKVVPKIPKGATLTPEMQAHIEGMKRHTYLILRRSGTWLLADGTSARQGWWRVDKTLLGLMPEKKSAKAQAALALYYISKDKKTLTPVQNEKDEGKTVEMRFVRVSKSEKIPASPGKSKR